MKETTYNYQQQRNPYGRSCCVQQQQRNLLFNILLMFSCLNQFVIVVVVVGWSGHNNNIHEKRYHKLDVTTTTTTRTPPSSEEPVHGVPGVSMQRSESSSSCRSGIKSSTPTHERRQFLQTLLVGTVGFSSSTLLPVLPANAASEMGTKLNELVTQSGLGLSVRRSVVQGAQVIDKIDGTWEKFSDQFQLGTERSKQIRPTSKVIPPLQPLDKVLATEILNTCDHVFCQVTNISKVTLQKQIEKVAILVGPSFLRSGNGLTSNDVNLVTVNLMDSNTMKNSIENHVTFNYASYVHYKAYSDLILLQQNLNFRTFKQQYEEIMGEKIVQLLFPASVIMSTTSSTTTTTTEEKEKKIMELQKVLESINQFCNVMVSKGLIAAYDQSTLDPEDVDDWATSASASSSSMVATDLSWTLAVDGDCTLSTQLLLQEQGYRFYPNYIRYGVNTLLQNSLGGSTKNNYDCSITLEDYYMDTNYNSDPDLFEVKEVLININVENR